MNPIQKTAETEYLGNIYKDVSGIEINSEDTLQGLMNKFYAVMKKHGICQGNWTEGGSRRFSTPEWAVCWILFRSQIDHKFMWIGLMDESIPEQLLAYGEKPQTETK